MGPETGTRRYRNGSAAIVFSLLFSLCSANMALATDGTLTWKGPSSGGSWDDAANWDSDYAAGTFSDWLSESGYSTTFDFSTLADGAAVTTATVGLRIGGLTLPSSAGTWTFTGTGSARAVFGTDINTPMPVTVPSNGKVIWRVKVPLDTTGATDCGFNLYGGGSFCIDAEFRPYRSKVNVRAYDGTVIIGANMPSAYNSGMNYAGISLIGNKGKLVLERDVYLGTLWSVAGNSGHNINLNGHTAYLANNACVAGTLQGDGNIVFHCTGLSTVQSPIAGVANYSSCAGWVTFQTALPAASTIGASMGGDITLDVGQTVAGLNGSGSSARITLPDNAALTVAPVSGNASEYQGRLVGGGSLALNGAGSTLTLSGHSTYSGTTDVNAGALVLDGPCNFPEEIVFRLPFDGDSTYAEERLQGLASLTAENGLPLSYSTAPAGAFGKALRFNHDACWRLRVQNMNKYDVGSALTISVWVKPTATGAAGNGCVFHTGSGWGETRANYDLIWLRFGANADKRTFAAAQLQGKLPEGVTFDDGDWHHICFTQGGRSRKLYLDGVLVDSATTSQDISTTWGNRFCLGAIETATTSANGSAYDGDMDEFMIINRECTAKEVAALAHASFPMRKIDDFAEELPSPLAHWAFDDSSDIGRDSSGNGHTLSVASGSPSIKSSVPGAQGKYLDLAGNASLHLDTFPNGFPTGKSSFTLAVRFAKKDTVMLASVVGWGDFSTANRYFCAGVYTTADYTPPVAYVSWNQTGGASFADKSGPFYVNADSERHWITYVFAKDTNETVRIYREGVLLSTTTWDVPNVDISPANFYVGYRPSTRRYFTGLVDDIRLYGKALSEREVQVLTLDMRTSDPIGSTLPETTAFSVASGAKAVFSGQSQVVNSLSGGGELTIAPFSTLTISDGGNFSGSLKGWGTLRLAGGVTTLSGDVSDWHGIVMLDGGRLVLSGPATGLDVAVAENSRWTIEKDGTGMPAVTGAGNVVLPGALVLSFPDGLRKASANILFASGTSVVADEGFTGWTADPSPSKSGDMRTKLSGGELTVRMLGLGGMALSFR
ncbi:MAG: hypothetical protein IKO72_09390 [Kiritimatiellae bacterium]|nr:hypothetical protein [Kiritimatiellia bacterium]